MERAEEEERKSEPRHRMEGEEDLDGAASDAPQEVAVYPNDPHQRQRDRQRLPLCSAVVFLSLPK